MLTAPETITRVANAETVTLGLASDRQPSSVALVPRIGEGRALALVGGRFEFPAMAAPDLVTVKWLDDRGETMFTTYVEVVTRHYFAIDELTGYGDGQDEFGDLPEEVLWQARQAATEVFEEAANRSYVHRVGRTKDYGRIRFIHLRHNDVYELLTEGYRLVSDCQVEAGRVGAVPEWIEYLYGAGSVPAQVSRATLELAAYMLRPTNRPVGATGESTDAGYIHFTTAGRDGATDIPEVNAAIEMFGRGPAYVW